MKDPGHISLAAWHQDINGHDLARDHAWEYVDPSGFYPDPSLQQWPRVPRSYLKRSPVRREDFAPTASHQRGAVPAPTDCQGNSPSGAAGYPAGGVPSS